MSRLGFVAATSLAVALGVVAYHPSARAADLTEGQARNVFIDSGCTNPGGLSRDSNGMWRATCQKTPVPAEMAINSDGKVVPAPTYNGITRGAAHSMLVKAGCSNVSTLAQDTSGNWHATCQGTPLPTQMMVSADGKVGKDTGYAGMSEHHVRSILMNAGCSTISGLGTSANGGWTGMCWKGGQPVQASVSPDGKATFH